MTVITWPGAEGLPQLPFKRLFTPVKRTPLTGAPIVTAYTDGQVTLRSNRAKVGYHEAADTSTYLGVRTGDFVVHGLDIMRGSVGIADSDGVISPVCTVCIPTPLIEPRYAAYAMRLQAASDFPKALARGVREGGADFRRWDTLAELPLPVPPVDAQRAIADFLDRETAQIDAFIAKNEELIALLTERRVAVVANRIAGSTGIEQGEKLGYSCRLGNGSTPRREETRYWEGGYFPWLNSSVVNRDRVESADQFVTGTALAECHLPTIEPGAIVVGLTGEGRTRGMATIVDIESTISQHLGYIQPDTRRWAPDYLLWLVRSRYIWLRDVSDANGATKGGLTVEQLRSMRVERPSLVAQVRSAAEITEQTARITDAIDIASRGVRLAHERRAALISAAVTGKIDVGVAA